MNYFSSLDDLSKFAVVTKDELDMLLFDYDYERDGWSDAILYIEKRTGKVLGYISNDGQYHVHRGIIEAQQ